MRFRTKVHGPRDIYREEILRRAWCLHVILAVFWCTNCDSSFDIGQKMKLASGATYVNEGYVQRHSAW